MESPCKKASFKILDSLLGTDSQAGSGKPIVQSMSNGPIMRPKADFHFLYEGLLRRGERKSVVTISLYTVIVRRLYNGHCINFLIRFLVVDQMQSTDQLTRAESRLAFVGPKLVGFPLIGVTLGDEQITLKLKNE